MPGVNISVSAEESEAQRGVVPGPREGQCRGLGAWPLRARLQGRTHVGQGQGAPAAARVGLLVAPQLGQGPRLAEQRPDVVSVQAQCLLAVLQRLLIQALPERSRQRPVSLLPSLPQPPAPTWTEDQPPFPAEEEDVREGLESSGKQLWRSGSVEGMRVSSRRGCCGAVAGHGGERPLNCTVMSPVTQKTTDREE